MKNITTCGNQFKSAAIAAVFGILLGGLAPNRAQAGFEDVYLDNYDYYLSLYQSGYDYETYYLGLALPSYYYYSAVYYGGYYSVYSDGYGWKATAYSSGPGVFDYFAGLGDSYFRSYY